MSITRVAPAGLSPAEVHDSLGQHILADGLDMVLDLERSHGVYLYDSKHDRSLLDFFSSYSTCPLGYNHPKIDTPEFRERILPSALNKPSNADLYTTEMAEFVAVFGATIPDSLARHIFFIEGGALAVENTLKTAFDWKVRKNLAAGKGEKDTKIIHFENAFHGRSGYTLSLTNTADPRKTQFFPKFDWPRVSTPGLHFPVDGDELARVAAAEDRTLAEIEHAIVDNPDEIAALILEPIQGEGGDNHFRPEFLQRLRDLADESEFLLIFDEVQTGFATTGRWWSFEHFNVEPDVFAFGKKSQVCGIAAGPRINDVESVFKVSSRINSTWGGNLADMVRCQRIIEIIEEDRLLESATKVGRQLVDGLWKLAAADDRVSNCRGLGMFTAFDLPSTDSRDELLRRLLAVGLLALPAGHLSVRFRPPVSLSAEEANDGLDRVESALKNLGAGGTA